MPRPRRGPDLLLQEALVTDGPAIAERHETTAAPPPGATQATVSPPPFPERSPSGGRASFHRSPGDHQRRQVRTTCTTIPSASPVHTPRSERLRGVLWIPTVMGWHGSFALVGYR